MKQELVLKCTIAVIACAVLFRSPYPAFAEIPVDFELQCPEGSVQYAFTHPLFNTSMIECVATNDNNPNDTRCRIYVESYGGYIINEQYDGSFYNPCWYSPSVGQLCTTSVPESMGLSPQCITDESPGGGDGGGDEEEGDEDTMLTSAEDLLFSISGVASESCANSSQKNRFLSALRMHKRLLQRLKKLPISDETEAALDELESDVQAEMNEVKNVCSGD